MKLIQVSDLHFVPPGTRLFGIDPRERLAAAIEDINAKHADAELCLFTGDLADHGAPLAYGALREVLSDLRPPHRLLIGNHDDRANFTNAFPEAPRDDNGFVQSVVRASAGNLVLLDTHEPGSGAGSYCAVRQAWLRARIGESAGRPVYLFLHHPPFDIGIPSLDRIRLLEEHGLAEAIEGADIRHIFFGHVHRPVNGSWRGIPYSALRSTVHQVPLDFGDRRSMPYSYEPPAYNVILISRDLTVVHHHDYMNREIVPPGTERYSAAE
jgi:3',5'-cyclic-AMP phosphodiesterase